MRNSFAPDGSVAREDEANDCLTDRQAVLDEQVTKLILFFVYNHELRDKALIFIALKIVRTY